MASKLFKYCGPNYATRVLPEAGGGILKCSLPRAFNDPYELYLSIDPNDKPELLAFYDDVVGELEQLPTTCFSRSPSVLPMWAHYAQNLEGFAIEVDEAVLEAMNEKLGFGDVDYQDSPHASLNASLRQAFETCKPRHTFLLRKAVFSAAYYTKTECWSYERERRMIVNPSAIRVENGLMLFDVPLEAITRVICGPRITADIRTLLHERCRTFGYEFLEMKIARSSATPYFVDEANRCYVFVDDSFELCRDVCDKCHEPISADSKLCTWCKIQDSHRLDAAKRNPYRVLDHHGMLPDYVAQMNELASGARKRKE